MSTRRARWLRRKPVFPLINKVSEYVYENPFADKEVGHNETLVLFFDIFCFFLEIALVTALSAFLQFVYQVIYLHTFDAVVEPSSCKVIFAVVDLWLNILYFLRRDKRFWCCSANRVSPPFLHENTVKVVILHTIVFFGMCFYQCFVLHEWKYYSLENYFKQNSGNGGFDFGQVDLPRALNMLIIHPIKEEIYFRVVLVSLIRKRLKSWMETILATSFFFALLHVSNFYSSNYAVNYVILQCCFALIVGSFYAVQFALTRSFCDVIVLHITNNVFASFVSSKDHIDFDDRLLNCLFAGTLAFYSFVCIKGFEELKQIDLNNDIASYRGGAVGGRS